MRAKTAAPVIGFLQLELLDHRAHGAVEVDDALPQQRFEALSGR